MRNFLVALALFAPMFAQAEAPASVASAPASIASAPASIASAPAEVSAAPASVDAGLSPASAPVSADAGVKPAPASAPASVAPEAPASQGGSPVLLIVTGLIGIALGFLLGSRKKAA